MKADELLHQLAEQAVARSADTAEPGESEATTRELLALVRAHKDRQALEEILLWRGAHATIIGANGKIRLAVLRSPGATTEAEEEVLLENVRQAARTRQANLQEVMEPILRKGQNLMNYPVGTGRLGNLTKAQLEKYLAPRAKALRTVSIRMAWLTAVADGLRKPEERVSDHYKNAALWKLYKAAEKGAAAA